MLSIKNSVCSALLLASFATATPQWSGTQGAGNLSVEYCSKDNTGSSNDQGSNIYQSLGACYDKCQGKFAYAVLQYQECWCSNDKPEETVDVEKCDQNCPGYPDQNCGSKDAGLYGYVPLDGGDATSTASSSSASSSGSSSSNSTLPTLPASTHGASSNGSSSASGHGSSTGGNGNSTTSSDAADATYTGAAASLAIPAVFGVVMSCAFGLAL